MCSEYPLVVRKDIARLIQTLRYGAVAYSLRKVLVLCFRKYPNLRGCTLHHTTSRTCFSRSRLSLEEDNTILCTAHDTTRLEHMYSTGVSQSARWLSSRGA